MDKTEILAAIKRCAVNNGGVPIGRARFAQLTGIREADWSGKYWARWSDAVREAGYEPNTLNRRQPDADAEALGTVAALIRQIGRFPTTPELKLLRRQDLAFPSVKRFGSRAELATKLMAHCANDPELSDVQEICAGVSSATRMPSDELEKTDGLIAGEVYLMKSGRHYKIGRSNSSGRRSYEVALQLPERLHVVHVITTDDSVGIERYWHQRFADRRGNGEWFALTAADVVAFRRRSFM